MVTTARELTYPILRLRLYQDRLLEALGKGLVDGERRDNRGELYSR